MKTIAYLSLINAFCFIFQLKAFAQNNEIYHLRYETCTDCNTNNPQYSEPIEFVTSLITSDYGRRREQSKWHKGVDFGLIEEDKRIENHILSLNHAVVFKICGESGYKYIFTEGDLANRRHSFGYGHIFESTEVPIDGMRRGDMVLKRMNGDDNDKFAIINLSTGIAIGDWNDDGGTVTYMGIPYDVTSAVAENAPIGIIGNSISNGTVGIHVHLYYFKDICDAIVPQGHDNVHNDKDPLDVVSHVNTNYTVTIDGKSLFIDNLHYIDNDNVVVSSGNDAISLRVRYQMQGGSTGSTYSTVVMNVDNIDLFIKKSHENDEDIEVWGTSNSKFQLIKGPWVESKVSHNARLESELYPTTVAPANPPNNNSVNIANLSGAQHGSTTRTGIDPYAYTTSIGYPYDDYYFSDFFTRIHYSDEFGHINRQMAICNEDSVARYPDGKYNIYAKVTTVKDNVFKSNTENPTEIIIDNFRPFIKKVEIRKAPEGQATYSRSWEWSGTSYLFQPPPENLDIKTNDNLFVKVFTSEPMTDVTLVINDNERVGTISSDDETEWEFTIVDGQLIPGENTLNINGHDLASHQIINLPSYIPIRQANNNWLPNPSAHTGVDQNHVFEAVVPGPVDFTAAQSAAEERVIHFEDRSTVANINQYEWDFGDGNSTSGSSATEVSHYYFVAGVWPVVHTVIDGDEESYSVTKEVIVDDLEIPEANFIYSMLPINGRTENSVTLNFYDESEGVVNSWAWNFGSAGSSIEQNPQGIVFDYDTPYQIRLTVQNYQGPNSITKNFYFDPNVTPFAQIVDWHEMSFNYNFDVSAANMDGPYLFEIDYGDGTSESRTEENLNWTTFDHQYFNWGEYMVSARVTGVSNGQSYTALAAKEINIRSWDLTVQLSYSAPTSPPYPGCQVTEITATVYGGNPNFYGTWYMYEVGVPGSYYSFTTGSGPTIEPWIKSFEKAGTYKVGLEANSLSGGYGHGEMTINVENAPQFVDAGFYPLEPIRLGTNSIQTFETSIWPIGDPGVPDNQHNPTNIRWTLYKGLNIIEPSQGQTTQSFPFDLSWQHRYIQYTFVAAGNYKLVLETWNDTHGYTEQELDTSCARTLPFYDYIVKNIEVSDDFPFLEIIDPVAPEYNISLDATAQPVFITLTNPGHDNMTWTAENDPGVVGNDFFNIVTTSNTIIHNGETGVIWLFVSYSNNPGTRYGAVRIRGFDENGVEVQGSPMSVSITQEGFYGPRGQFVYNSPPISHQNFGTSVSIDDNYAVVGAVEDNEVGKAFILERNNVGIWHAVATLQASDSYNSKFGRSVDIHGEYVIVGANERAYIFKRPTSGWSGTVNSIASSINCADYGRKVSIWGDWAVVSGFDWIKILYRNQGGNADSWGLNHTIEGGAGTRLGYNIDLYNDLLAVGIPDVGKGEIHIYNRNHSQANDWGLEYNFQAPYYAPSDAFLGGKGFDIYDNKLFYAHRGEREVPSVPSLTTNMLQRNENGVWSNIQGSSWTENETSYAEISNFDTYAGNSCAISPSIHDGIGRLDGFNSRPYDVAYYDPIWGEFWVGGCMAFRQWDIYTPYIPYAGEWNTGSEFGYSVETDHNSEIVGGPNKNSDQVNDCGSVYIYDYRYRDLCTAQIELNLINFDKPAGNYPDVQALNIKLGGLGYDAIIRNGANINYSANEIVLDDGFFAEQGSEFLAEAIECGSQSRKMNLPDNYNYIDEHSFVEGKMLISDEFREQDYLIISLQEMRRILSHRLPSFSWGQINFLTEIDQIEIVAKDRTVIASISNPNPIICLFEKKALPSEYDINIKVGKRTFCVASSRVSTTTNDN